MERPGNLHILHIEDDEVDAELIRQTLLRSGLGCRITLAMSRSAYLDALQKGGVDLILSDNRGYDFDGLEVLRSVRRHHPDIPFLFLSGSFEGKDLKRLKAEGAADCLLKTDLDALAPAIGRALEATPPPAGDHYLRGLERLVAAAQQLPLARDQQALVKLVCGAARALVGADGVTLSLREGEFCHVVGEDSDTPLWQGQRFPLEQTASGWAMLNREIAVIEDIHTDPRVPQAFLRGSVMKSAVVAPIRTGEPVGVIVAYWRSRHRPCDEELKLLQALAELVSASFENLQRQAAAEQQLREKSRDLEAVNKELESFSYSVSHDLRGPLRSVTGFGKLLAKDYDDKLDEAGKTFLAYVTDGTQRIAMLVDALLDLSRVSRFPLKKESLDLSAMAGSVLEGLREKQPKRRCEVRIEPGLQAEADPQLMRIVLENLLGNAWKFTAKRAECRIEFGRTGEGGREAFFVRDNGAGFEMAYADKLFTPFQRQHRQDEFEGAGVGLAAVQRILQRHGGRVWAEAVEGEGASFFFTVADAGHP
ncbi:MAG TPA: ATP-binding protein [Gammaproteobacteria bacterium]|jgi:hypothetical protein|nr:ATP-binding protein [Gammaproteobacteria bacterium]